MYDLLTTKINFYITLRNFMTNPHRCIAKERKGKLGTDAGTQNRRLLHKLY